MIPVSRCRPVFPVPVSQLTSDLAPLVLAPSDETGWFGGTPLLCVDPVIDERSASLEEVAAALESVIRAEDPMVAAALLPYSGPARLRVYSEGSVYAPHAEHPDDGTATSSSSDMSLLQGWEGDFDMPAYVAAVEWCQERIRAGDVYVLNLTTRICGRPALGPVHAFNYLAARFAGSMSALWLEEDRSVVSISPERFLSVGQEGGRRVEVWPIKGTRPRCDDPAKDAEMAAGLLADPKEHAEHVMIVDLERNDLGRVCEAGSVRADPLCEVFQTPYCHQMVSRVSGALRQDASIGELLEATFPCGSVTGAPKVAAMRAIESIERSSRGVYTGALVVAIPGALDSSVLIRTLEYRSGGTACWGTGGGITIDSDPEAEWQEALLKARPVTG